MDASYYWVGGLCFAAGIGTGMMLFWLGAERSEKYIKRLIDHGAVNLNTCLQQMMSTRIKQEESLLQEDQRWRNERQKEHREYSSQQFDKYEVLRHQDIIEQQTAKEIMYNLPLPPDGLSDNFCPEDHMLELRKGIRDYKLNYDTLLPWIRSAMMAGYSSGKKIAIVAAKKKGGKK